MQESKKRDARWRRKAIGCVCGLAAVAGLVVWMLMPPDDLQPSVFRNIPTLKTKLLIGRGALAEAFSLPVWLILPFLGLMTLWMAFRRMCLSFLLLLLVLLGIICLVYFNYWHSGLLLYVGIYCLWVGESRRGLTLGSSLACLLLMLPSLIFGVLGAFHTAQTETFMKYSGARAAADFLNKNELKGARIYVAGGPITALQPWLPRGMFMNFGRPGSIAGYWDWSSQNVTPVFIDKNEIEELRPDIIIQSTKFGTLSSRSKDGLYLQNYTLSAVFEGNLLWKGKRLEDDSYVLFTSNKYLRGRIFKKPYVMVPGGRWPKSIITAEQ